MQKAKFTKIIVGVLTGSFFLASCNSQQTFNQKLSKALEEDPSIITKAIENNPTLFLNSLQKAAQSARAELAKQRELEEQKKLESAFKSPLKPLIRKDEAFRGNEKAPITIVEYSDFQCPFCLKGHQVLQELKKEYKNNIRVVYKHLPLDFHPQAMIASQYYEALRLQDKKLAFAFHDKVFEQQRLLKKGESFLKKIAKEVGADMKRLAKDVNREDIKQRIKDDIEEASKFGMRGTPGFIVNGIPIKGAQPKGYFVNIIKELQKRNMVQL